VDAEHKQVARRDGEVLADDLLHQSVLQLVALSGMRQVVGEIVLFIGIGFQVE